MKPTRLAALAAALVASALPACGDGGKRYPEYRYRLTVEVDTPEGLKTGSSVIEVSTWVSGPNSIPTPNWARSRVSGEAVTIDLGSRGRLFALLRGVINGQLWPAGVMTGVTRPGPTPRSEWPKLWNFDVSMERMLRSKELHVLPRIWLGPDGRSPMVRYEPDPNYPSAYPIMVHFRDLHDPASVEQVHPDHLDRAFGPGVKLRRITAQLTHEEPSFGIDRLFPWWDQYKDRHLDGTGTVVNNPYPAHVSGELTRSDFSRRGN